MALIDADCGYQAILTHDPRFDGVFFVGVTTTRIYCRSVCRAKTPQRKNCTFYPSAAAAEQAGFRPCLLCRPELSPGNARIDATGRLAAAVAKRMEEGSFIEQRFGDLALEFGVSDRHLRRVVQQEFGVSPIELAQTQRLLLAKRLLTDTALPIADIAYASGFGSLRRFNALFQDRYLGILATRAKTIVALAQAIAEQTLSLASGYPVEQTIAQLQDLPGIGPWTAHYIAMRVLSDPDIFLPNDLGIQKALGETNLKRMLAIAATWQPWRSYATLHLWKLLERGEVFGSALVAPPAVA